MKNKINKIAILATYVIIPASLVTAAERWHCWNTIRFSCSGEKILTYSGEQCTDPSPTGSWSEAAKMYETAGYMNYRSIDQQYCRWSCDVFINGAPYTIVHDVVLDGSEAYGDTCPQGSPQNN